MMEGKKPQKKRGGKNKKTMTEKHTKRGGVKPGKPNQKFCHQGGGKKHTRGGGGGETKKQEAGAHIAQRGTTKGGERGVWWGGYLQWGGWVGEGGDSVKTQGDHIQKTRGGGREGGWPRGTRQY